MIWFVIVALTLLAVDYALFRIDDSRWKRDIESVIEHILGRKIYK